MYLCYPMIFVYWTLSVYTVGSIMEKDTVTPIWVSQLALMIFVSGLSIFSVNF
jgi:hypothetical protein